VQYAGFVNNDTAAALGTSTLAFGCVEPNGQAVGAATPVGTYPIVPSGLNWSNYAITYAPGFLTVTKKDLVVNAKAASKVYGEVNPVFELDPNAGGLVNGDSLLNVVGGVPRFKTAAVTNSAVGTYPVTPEGLVSANYNLIYKGEGLLTVTPAL